VKFTTLKQLDAILQQSVHHF